jgi:tetratricopeptide (TPR) repeat protein
MGEACDSYQRALALDPTVEGALNNLGMALRELGKLDEAVEAFRRASDAAPQSADAWANYGMALKECGRLDDAETALQRALALDSRSVVALTQLGGLRAKQERIDEAIAAYRAVVAIQPEDAEANDNLGWALLLTVKDAPLTAPDPETLSYLEKAVALAPERWSGWENLGNALLRFNRFHDALVAYNRATALLRRPNGGHDRHLTFRLTSRAKLAHDAEQIRYLMEQRRIGTDGPALLAAYDTALARLPAPPPDSHIVEMDPSTQDSIGATYNRLWNVAEAPEIPGGAVSRLDRTAVEADYAAREPGITWVDNLLTPEALSSLRRFCLESTIWFDCFYKNDYLGAFIEDGFYCPLLLQIGRELPGRLPGIFGNHTLRKVWAYKYGDRLKGIESHADFAAVNVNFWITPDDANLDPNAGGLVIWDKKTPPEWDFTTFNTDQRAMDDFIRASGAKAHTVPHRCNRAVIFNSDLIHRTDDIRFRPGYANRRINVTFLYGVREGRV